MLCQATQDAGVGVRGGIKTCVASPPVTDARGNSHMGASASTKINRKDFGVSGNPGVVGDEITITIDAELISAAAPPAAK